MPHFLGFHLCSASEVVSDDNRISLPICVTRNVNVTQLLLRSMSVLEDEQTKVIQELDEELEQQAEKKKAAVAGAAKFLGRLKAAPAAAAFFSAAAAFLKK
jgi:hypothetical protein